MTSFLYDMMLILLGIGAEKLYQRWRRTRSSIHITSKERKQMLIKDGEL